jgi:glycosyltransferase involved in cell wall biosynthesis
MRILYCNKYSFRFSGTEAYLFDLMEMMRGKGHATALFSVADPRGEKSEYERFFLKPINFKDTAAGWSRKMRLAAHAIYSRDARSKLARLIEEFRPDVAHVRNIYHHLSPSIFWEFKKRHVPVIYHLNDFKLLCPNYNFVAGGETCELCRGGNYWQAVRTGCYAGGRGAAAVLAAEAYAHRWMRTYERCVDLFLAPSEFVRDKLVAYGWPHERIEVLPHFQRIPESSDVPAEERRGVLYFGRLSTEKGLRELLRAMAQLPEVPLILAGEGPMRAELEQLQFGLKLRNVEFAGQLRGEELARAIARSRFTVFPSRAYETLGKSMLESYACGRAVVASDLGSRREFVRPGETGLLYEPGNVEEMVRAIAFLYKSPRLCSRLGLAGRELVLKNHAPDQHGEVMCSLYQRVIASTRASGGPVEAERDHPNLRIAFIGGRGVISKYSGIEAYYEEAGERLAARGHYVTVYCRNYFTPDINQYRGMRLLRLPTIRSKHFETLIHTALSTAHAITQDYDVIHYHALGPALFAFVPRLFGVKTAVTVQGLDGQRKKWGRVAAAVLGIGERAAIRCADSTMVVSQALHEHYRRRYAEKPVYVANGAKVREKADQTRLAGWGLTPEGYVLFLGRFSPEKNCHLLVQAFEAADLPAHLVLAGGGTDAYSKELATHASDKIRMLSYVSGAELDELLTNAMLFVLPSDLEGLSLALLEAMGAGLCVLASDIPENRELVDGVGFTFRAGDVGNLEEMLRVLIASPSVRAEAGRKARQRVLACYDWDEISEKIEEEYLRIAGRPEDSVRALRNPAESHGRHDKKRIA